MTSHSTVVPLRQPEETEDPLTAILRSGARRLLAQAIEAEAEAFLARMKAMRAWFETGSHVRLGWRCRDG
jgi:putative transposase